MYYHEELKNLVHQYIKLVYKVTKDFPKDELYGVTSQLRRSTISVMLNYIEGYARRKGQNCKVYKNFIETSYGSLKESEYLVYFSFSEKYIKEKDYEILSTSAVKIGGMLYGIINKIN
jgi:four helix bundle protein